MANKQTTPPRWADWFLERCLAPHLLEDVLGDLYEIYVKRVDQVGIRRARREYGLAALRYITLFFIQRKPATYPSPAVLSPTMIRNYFIVSWRHLIRNRLLSAINIIGLALGMSCSLLIWLWINDEWHMDKNYKDIDRLYFVRQTNGVYTNGYTPGPLAEALKRDIPDVEKATRFTSWTNDYLIQAGQTATKEIGMYVSDDFFDVFQFPAVQGNASLAIHSPGKLVITRRLAQKLFGSLNVVGRTVRLNDEKYYQVGAVIENIPSNVSLQADWLTNLAGNEEDWMENWGNNSFRTYVKLLPTSQSAQAEARMKGLLKRYKADATDDPILQPLGDTYLYGEYTNGKPTGGRISYVRNFGLVAFLILLIACVNFMNLATARSSLRAKEVGVRKVVGARRSSLAGQFMGEAVLLSLLAMGLALGLLTLLLPALNQLVGKQLSINILSLSFWFSVLLLVSLTSLVAGSYPALFLSAMQPVRVLKGSLATAPTGATFRKGLVVVQFSLALFLISGMLIIGRQMHFIRTKQLGLDRENVIRVPVEGRLRAKMETFRQELQRTPFIQSVTTTGEVPVRIASSSTGGLTWPGKDPKREETVYTMKVGYRFTQTMNIRLLAGRDFAPTDSGAHYLINESAAKLMGLKQPVGTELTYQIGKGRIVGLMQDFHLNSFHEPIQPLVLSLYPQWTNYFLIKTRPGQTAQAIHSLEQLAKQLNPGYPFTYHFIDEDYEQLYRSETVVNQLINYFGIVAILISCLGLFGLATFTAEQRRKEIGVRKVLGATVGSIVALLTKDFLKLVLIAILIASPIAWYTMNQWLNGFAYKIGLSWWIFALAGLMAIAIALLTVSFQSVKAALMNPVKSLRSE